MKFYVIANEEGDTVGAETSIDASRRLARMRVGAGRPYTIQRVTCPVNSETILKLLGQRGAYSTSAEIVERKNFVTQ